MRQRRRHPRVHAERLGCDTRRDRLRRVLGQQWPREVPAGHAQEGRGVAERRDAGGVRMARHDTTERLQPGGTSSVAPSTSTSGCPGCRALAAFQSAAPASSMTVTAVREAAPNNSCATVRASVVPPSTTVTSAAVACTKACTPRAMPSGRPASMTTTGAADSVLTAASLRPSASAECRGRSRPDTPTALLAAEFPGRR